MKMKKILLSMIAISCIAFAGCANNNSTSSSSSNPTSNLENSSNSSPSISTNSSTNSSKEEKIPTEKINSFLASIKNNFTYEEKSNDIHTKYLFDDNKFYDSLKEQYITLEEEIYYLYAKTDDGYWHKNFADENQKSIFNFSSTIISAFDSISWTEYDENAETFYGNKTLENKSVSLKLDVNGKATLTNDNDIITISDINKTKITLPENVIDDTIVNDKIYTVDENGNYDFNITLLHNILDDWFKENNQWNNDNYKDALAYLMRGVSNNVKYGNMVYLDVTKEKFSMAVIHDVNDKTYLRSVSIKDDTWSEYLSNNENSNSKNFKNHLNSLTWRQFSYDQMGIKIDETMNNEDFDAMTVNIFNRLADIGYQGRDISNEGTKVEGLKPENVVFSFATVKSDVHAGLGLGWKREWSHYYLINIGNECKWIKVDVASSEPRSELGPNYMVINDEPDCWYVTSYEETILDSENANLHTQPQE